MIKALKETGCNAAPGPTDALLEGPGLPSAVLDRGGIDQLLAEF